MSAVTWAEVAASNPVARESRHVVRRRHLSLVPSPAPGAAGAPRQRRRSVVLTGRGRVVLAGLVLLPCCLVLLAHLAPAPAADSVPVPRTGPAIVVQPGQTLSEIAAERLPTLSIRDGVAAIQIANNLSTTAIDAGRRLVIPRL